MQYPSIIRAHNLDYATIVLDPAYAAVPGVEYYEVTTGLGTFRFAQGVPAVLPQLLESLAAHRKAAKRDMAEAKARGDDWAASVANGRQLAMKVTMNSVYGFAGATKGFLPCVPIAASVTATGRLMIQKTKALAESLVPGSRVVYGDSVAGHTPVLVRWGPDRAVAWVPIERLAAGLDDHLVGDGDDDGDDGEKQCLDLAGVDVWSDLGWTRVHRVIRHRVRKPMVRVLTRTGLVDVTTDHSLLLRDGTPVTPGEVRPGGRLLHRDLPPELPGPAAGGPAGKPAGKPLTCAALAAAMGRKFSHGDGKLPPRVLAAARHVREAFWDGLTCDGELDPPPLRNHVVAAQLAQLAASVGVTVGVSADENGHVRLTSYHVPAWEADTVVSVTPLPPKRADADPYAPHGEYVYDLTTDNHHFAAGVGRLVVHNTDSVMVIFDLGEAKRHDMAAHFETGQRVAGEISGTFKAPIELEFEKCYYPYLLFNKKRYSGESGAARGVKKLYAIPIHTP